ncbi:MAG TPA: fatty acid desaturase [Mariprofundaceae bacterium]|nr:fatty acid desaturase [Mariprofundaceae bacterium]
MLERLNFTILLLSLAATWACLWAASHAAWWLALLAAWCFSLINMLPFSLLHEAVHGVGSPSKARNRLLGMLGGMAFGTSLSMQTVAHLGHHKRNRTDVEMYDYYLPSESKALRNLWLYAGNLSGLYWFCIPFSNAVYLLAPWAYRSKLFVDRIAPKLGFGPYVRELVELPVARVWREIALVWLYQAGLWWWLDLTWQGWLLCYWLFALHWSALQYVDHAWSARDIVNGAWNLKVSAPARWLALNYHYHLAHHQHPHEPWTRLPELVDTDAPQPTFWKIYFSLWKGVRPAPPMGAPADLLG